MPQASVTLPNDEDVELTYWETPPHFVRFGALQSLRSKRMAPVSAAASEYSNMAPIYAGQFATLFDSSWSVVVSPPSSNDMATPYLKAIVTRTHARDISGRFGRIGSVRSSNDPPPTLADLTASLTYRADGDESELTSVLFVDDVFASGRTLAAVLHHLRQAGLQQGCKVGAAAPLWIKC